MQLAKKRTFFRKDNSVPGYEVEYIKSDGIAYFNASEFIKSNNSDISNDYWSVTLGVDKNTTGDHHLFGNVAPGFGLAVYYGRWRPNAYMESGGSWGWSTSFPLYYTAYPVVEYVLNKGIIYFYDKNGTQLITSSNICDGYLPKVATDYKFDLYVGKMNNVPLYKGTSYIYRFKRILNNVLQFDFIPWVQDGIPGMLDLVSKQFRSSIVSTQFVAGPKV